MAIKMTSTVRLTSLEYQFLECAAPRVFQYRWRVKQRGLSLGLSLLTILTSIAITPARADSLEKSSKIQTSAEVFIDTTLFLPAKLPAPAILIAHGFGGSKDSVAADARYFQSQGYVVLTWSARGFGESSGLISMNSQDGEIADIKKLIDSLSNNNSVLKDSKGNPIIGITGASYGGAAALLTAASDSRIDAVVSDITWSSLSNALFPQSAKDVTTDGPFKKVWTGTFFALATLQRAFLGECGSLSALWCSAYKNAVINGVPTATDLALMNSVSPANFVQNIKAATLLMQGQADSLFPLAESQKTLAILEKSLPADKLSLIWHASGHDGGPNDKKYLLTQSLRWFNKNLKNETTSFPRFQFTRVNGTISLQDSTVIPKVFKSSSLPNSEKLIPVELSTQPVPISYPVGGVPSAITALPGIGSAGSLASSLLSNLAGFSPAFIPGQSAFIESQPMTKPISIIGSSSIKVRITSTTGSATLFFSLISKTPSGGTNQPNGIISPMRITDIPANGATVDIDLPAVVLDLAVGDKLAIGISSTDQGYEMAKESSFYTVTALSPLMAPTVVATNATSSASNYQWPIFALAFLLFAFLFTYLRRPRSSKKSSDQDFLVSIENLSKVYKDGYQAVSDLSFTVSRGQVLGLLGPNGAGKTTTLRMLMGLIFPTSGAIYLGGKAIYPGSPSLANLGSFVEGPGFLPHLSGRENIDLYWKSIGRTGEKYLDEVIAIANLGTALDKKVRAYSQGMRQRLAIAQAMLGMPDLLVLDEPTNGLDPQQIAEMRQVLRNYADTGRTVIVSSHLLTEVQQTCTDVVLMHRGKLVAFGPMKKILMKNRKSRSLEEIFLELIGDDLVIGKQS
jgi:ABC-2 type transport system ATP-binding protein